MSKLGLEVKEEKVFHGDKILGHVDMNTLEVARLVHGSAGDLVDAAISMFKKEAQS
jgi:hypothetical protein